MSTAVPPALLNLIQRLPESQQTKLLQIGARAVMDPWYGVAASVPAAWLLAYLPHFLFLGLAVPIQMFEYDNVQPRLVKWDEVLKPKAGAAVARLATRLRAAHLNGLEAFPAYAAAIILCRLNKVKPDLVRPLAARFLMLRTAYIAIYALGVNQAISYLRTVVWVLGVGVTAEIYALALLDGAA